MTTIPEPAIFDSLIYFDNFIYAIREQRLENVQRFIRRGFCITTKSGPFLYTVLHTACGVGNVDIVEYLIQEGASIEALDLDGSTPLHEASRYGNSSVVNLLLKSGAHMNVQDKTGRTPLHYAAWNNHLVVVKTLLENGANYTIKDTCGETAKSLAEYEMCNGEVVRTIQEWEEEENQVKEPEFN